MRSEIGGHNTPFAVAFCWAITARTSAWHQLVSESLCFAESRINLNHSVKKYVNVISISFLMYSSTEIMVSKKSNLSERFRNLWNHRFPPKIRLAGAIQGAVWWLHLRLVKLPNAKHPLQKSILVWKRWDEFQTHENTLNTTQTSMSFPSFWKGVCLGKYVL